MASSRSTVLVAQKGGGDGEDKRDEDTKEEDEKLTSSHFDRLPDEILTRIFTFALTHTYFRLPFLLLSKRLSAVVRSTWLSTWCPDDQDLQVLVRHSKLHPLLKRFVVAEPAPSKFAFEHECTMLSLFTNLTSVQISGWVPDYDDDDDDEAGRLSKAFTDTLRSLKHLKSLVLEIVCPGGLEDESFSVGKDVSSLEHLSIGVSCKCSTQLLSPPCSGNLKSLSLATGPQQDTPYPYLPWSSLEVLSISVDSGNETFSPIRELAKSLKAALFLGRPVAVNAPVSLPLHTFHLRNPVFEASKDPHFALKDLTKLFELLPHLSLRKLVLETGLALQPVSKMPKLETVETLTFHCSLDTAFRSKDLLALHSILLGFPNLLRLELFYTDFSTTTSATKRNSFPPSSPDFLLRHPPLCALLMSLRETTVRWVVWRPGPETYVWTRGGKGEEFEVERLKRF